MKVHYTNARRSADENIYYILQSKIISMEEKKQLYKKETQKETHTKKSWNSSYRGGLGALWIKKEENLNKWEMLWRKKRKCIN